MSVTKVTDNLRSTTALDPSKLSGAVAVAKGGTGLTAVGTSGNVLTSNGSAWASTAPAGGGAWTLIATQVLDNSSTTVDFTGLDETYDTIAMVVVNLNCSGGLWLRVGDSGGIDSGGSDYMYHSQDLKSNSSSYQAIANGGQSYMILSDSSGANSSNGSGLSGIWYLSGIQTSNSYPLVHGHYTWTFTPHAQGGSTVGMRVAQIDVDRVQFLCGSGNMVAGRITLYGISHT